MKSPRTKAITDRFIRAMQVVIHESAANKGKYKDYSAFARSLGELPQNFAKFYNNSQHVTLRIVAAAVVVHGFNPTWIFTNKGNMFLEDSKEETVASLTRQLRVIANKLDQLEKPKDVPKLKRRA